MSSGSSVEISEIRSEAHEAAGFWLLLFFAPYLAVFYLAHADTNGVPPRPGRALARFV